MNTFIDDLFAFIIKMPTMHRLSCFRDDLVFFIYIYQVRGGGASTTPHTAITTTTTCTPLTPHHHHHHHHHHHQVYSMAEGAETGKVAYHPDGVFMDHEPNRKPE